MLLSRESNYFVVFNLELAGLSCCIRSIYVMYLLYSDVDVCVKTSHLSKHLYTCSVQQFDISVNKRLKNFKSKHNSFASFNLCNEKLLKWMKI